MHCLLSSPLFTNQRQCGLDTEKICIEHAPCHRNGHFFVLVVRWHVIHDVRCKRTERFLNIL